MPVAAFDTLGAARELEAAGIARAQAEAIAQVINHGDERGVSKADLDAAIAGLETRLRADLASKADLREAIAGLATRAELREAAAGLATRAELHEAVAGLATRAELHEAAAGLATRAELREAVAGLATRAELHEAVAGLATRAELHEAVAGLATRAELSAIRDAIAGMRWTIGLLAAFMFAIGLRMFGLL